MPFFQPPVDPLPSGIDLSSKTIIITGASSGLGLETARQLTILRAQRVILAVRNVQKGELCRQQILADPEVRRNNPKVDMKVMKVDMADYKSVMEFANNVKKELPELDILLLNAGTGQLNFEVAITGHEKVMQINYLSNALLTLELLPLMTATADKKGTATRISCVGSRTRAWSTLPKKQPLQPGESVIEHFDEKKNYFKVAHYANTKLFVSMFIAEIAKRVPKEKVVINHMCPGAVRTGLVDVLPFPLRQIMTIVELIRSRTPEVGGWVISHAVAVAGPETHGEFLMDKEIDKMPYLSTKEGLEVQKMLWEETIDEMTRVDPRVAGVVPR